ncbi:HAD hydrolase-like protein [Ligilactobacillus acidipiscis]|uniref:HAD hydrolase-like protein n=1 Tax=Ligilactobacillus acidipiscis TaxID=89059 RepID=UPI0022E127E7|nr:HAD hydrolase-like protein [Ligilactobacillus acidipiscis]
MIDNYLIGLATSSDKERAVTILQQNKVLNYFDQLTFNVEIKVGKPAPDIYNTVLDKMSLKPDEEIIYEDS